MAIIVDSCVFLDIFTEDTKWFSWSSQAFSEAANLGAIVINPIIYAEISVRFSRIEDLEALLPPNVIDYRVIPREAAFLAGKSFLAYRKRGGRKMTPLPDFFIGAHAAVENLPLVTRDARRFREYFPRVSLIRP